MTRIICTLLLLFIANTLAQTCVGTSEVRFQSVNKRIEVNGIPASLKGANWWGMETENLVQGGLDRVSMSSIFDVLVNNGFNALRIPFALDVILNSNNRFPCCINYGANPDLQGLTSIQVLDKIFDMAAARGVVILLDQHRFDPSEKHSSMLWYTYDCITNRDGVCKKYTIADDKAGWSFIVNRYQTYWNFMGVDLINEPHGDIRWGSGNPANDWALASAEIGNHIITNFPNWKGLIYVEGNEVNPNCEILGFPGCETCEQDGHWWGGNLEGVRCAVVALSDQTRLVYSPHVYGASVFEQAYFTAADFPNNLEYIYDTHFNFVAEQTGRAVVIGEWGGFYTGKDKIIQDYQAAYFKRRGINSWFYWALNPNPGGDTDGIFQADWSAADPTKIAFLATASPNPTKFTRSGANVCINGASSSSGQSTTAPIDPTTTNPPTTPTTTPTNPTTTPTTPTTSSTNPTTSPTNPTTTPTNPTNSPTDPTSSSPSSSTSSTPSDPTNPDPTSGSNPPNPPPVSDGSTDGGDATSSGSTLMASLLVVYATLVAFM